MQGNVTYIPQAVSRTPITKQQTAQISLQSPKTPRTPLTYAQVTQKQKQTTQPILSGVTPLQLANDSILQNVVRYIFQKNSFLFIFLIDHNSYFNSHKWYTFKHR